MTIRKLLIAAVLAVSALAQPSHATCWVMWGFRWCCVDNQLVRSTVMFDCGDALAFLDGCTSGVFPCSYGYPFFAMGVSNAACIGCAGHAQGYVQFICWNSDCGQSNNYGCHEEPSCPGLQRLNTCAPCNTVICEPTQGDFLIDYGDC